MAGPPATREPERRTRDMSFTPRRSPARRATIAEASMHRFEDALTRVQEALDSRMTEEQTLDALHGLTSVFYEIQEEISRAEDMGIPLSDAPQILDRTIEVLDAGLDSRHARVALDCAFFLVQRDANNERIVDTLSHPRMFNIRTTTGSGTLGIGGTLDCLALIFRNPSVDIALRRRALRAFLRPLGGRSTYLSSYVFDEFVRPDIFEELDASLEPIIRNAMRAALQNPVDAIRFRAVTYLLRNGDTNPSTLRTARHLVAIRPRIRGVSEREYRDFRRAMDEHTFEIGHEIAQAGTISGDPGTRQESLWDIVARGQADESTFLAIRRMANSQDEMDRHQARESFDSIIYFDSRYASLRPRAFAELERLYQSPHIYMRVYAAHRIASYSFDEDAIRRAVRVLVTIANTRGSYSATTARNALVSTFSRFDRYPGLRRLAMRVFRLEQLTSPERVGNLFRFISMLNPATSRAEIDRLLQTARSLMSSGGETGYLAAVGLYNNGQRDPDVIFMLQSALISSQSDRTKGLAAAALIRNGEISPDITAALAHYWSLSDVPTIGDVWIGRPNLLEVTTVFQNLSTLFIQGSPEQRRLVMSALSTMRNGILYVRGSRAPFVVMLQDIAETNRDPATTLEIYWLVERFAFQFSSHRGEEGELSPVEYRNSVGVLAALDLSLITDTEILRRIERHLAEAARRQRAVEASSRRELPGPLQEAPDVVIAPGMGPIYEQLRRVRERLSR